jgi:periplasmic protein TonB
MHNHNVEQLDAAISAMLAGHASTIRHKEVQFSARSGMVSDLRYLPRPEFRARLRDDLVAQASLPLAARGAFDTSLTFSAPPDLKSCAPRESVLPMLFGTGASMLPVGGAHLAVSFALHVAALAVIFTSGWWMVEHGPQIRTQVASRFSDTVDYILPAAPNESHGGGGGGTHDKLPTSGGSAPRFAQEQLTPPTVIVASESPKLPAEPTVVGPPDIKLPQLGQTGDPRAAILNPPSNGVGHGGGIGSGQGGGVGVGYGPGVGDGRGGGTGGGVYRIGGGVSAPRAIYEPDPEYSEEARQAKYQGSVMLWAVIDAEGRPRELRIARPLGMGLDEKATEAVSRWRFTPALKDGRPVAVQIGIEVVFRLY